MLSHNRDWPHTQRVHPLLAGIELVRRHLLDVCVRHKRSKILASGEPAFEVVSPRLRRHIMP